MQLGGGQPCIERNGKDLEKSLLDFGGGSGLLVRLLRDVGIEAFWEDKYCQNLFARGFEWQEHKVKDNPPATPTLGTCFEVFEHLENPLDDIDSMLSLCPNLLFSTELLQSPTPQPYEWWYYGFSHGQHISFYTKASLETIAKRHGLHFSSCGGIHLFSARPISPLAFKLVLKLANRGLFTLLKKRFKSKMLSDHELLTQ